MIHLLSGETLHIAKATIENYHYTKRCPSGKSYYMNYDFAIVVWSIPANKNLARFLLPEGGVVWELSRLWAPDGHRENLLTQAISSAIKALRGLEKVDALVSYADPNAGHTGGVYKAASWVPYGQSEETRVYVNSSGEMVARRAFHSGKKHLRKAEIEALGYTEKKLPGKLRFVKPLTKLAKRQLLREQAQ